MENKLENFVPRTARVVVLISSLEHMFLNAAQYRRIRHIFVCFRYAVFYLCLHTECQDKYGYVWSVWLSPVTHIRRFPPDMHTANSTGRESATVDGRSRNDIMRIDVVCVCVRRRYLLTAQQPSKFAIHTRDNCIADAKCTVGYT